VRVGFLGLGAMGAHMARNLHKAGLLAAVWNRTAAKAADLAAQLPCAAPATPADLARQVDILVLCVSADQDVLTLIEALRSGLRAGQLVIDCSTVSAQTARRVAEHLSSLGVDFLDCPVSGGTEGARDGTLAIMCGGSAASFTLAQPVLLAMGRTVAHFGPVGAGQAAKATNQIMCAGIIEAVSEAMAFAKANGLPA
jgi:3-hydroxyisobutyrate dehydrogenase